MIDGLKPYPAMKDSGVPWLGEVPEHWRTERAKWLFRKMNRPIRDSDEVMTCFRDGTVTLRRNRRVRGFTESLKEIGYQGIRRGDLVIHAMDAFAGAIGVADADGKGTPVYSVCEPGPTADSHYYAYAVREMARGQWIQALAKGIRERSTDFRFEGFGSQPVPLPPLPEQAAIVRFLDHADRRIRRYIRAKQKLIKLLEEQKQAIIHRAVTRGLDPNVRLKPSGVEWLGEVPEHWEVLPLSSVLAEKLVRNIGLAESQVLSLSYGNIVIRPQERLHGLVPSSFETYQIVEPGDIIVRPTDLQNDQKSVRVGLVCHRGIITSAYMCLQVRGEIAPEWAYALLNAYDVRKVFYQLGSGTRQNLKFADIKRLPVLVPRLGDQTAIIRVLDSTCQSLSVATGKAQREIALLREYRTRLIADVVTGKLDVREAASLLPDEVEEPEPVDEIEAEGDIDEAGADDTDAVPEEAEA